MPTYDNYARTDRHGNIVIRYSVFDEWGKRGWPPSLAREFALHIAELADKAERESPRVTELTAFLEGGPEDERMEDLAVRLIRGGYRRKA